MMIVISDRSEKRRRRSFVFAAVDELEGEVEMCTSKGSVSYQKVKGIELEVNIVKCISLGTAALLANNDINATAAAIEVLGDEPEMISI